MAKLFLHKESGSKGEPVDTPFAKDAITLQGRGTALLTSRGLIPRLIDQNRCAHWRNPMDMIFQGRSMSVFQA
jgi:hypothetical protein